MSNIFSALSSRRFLCVRFVMAPQRLGTKLMAVPAVDGTSFVTRLDRAGLQDLVAQQELAPGIRGAFRPAWDRRHRLHVMAPDDS